MRIAGYAAVFDEPDRGGDIIRPGAFDRLPRTAPLLWQHKADSLIGRVDTLQPDEFGLLIAADLADTAEARAIFQLVLSGHVDGLSFGYRARSARRPFGRPWRRELLDLELSEISIVAEPMHPLARIIRPMEAILAA